MAADFVEDFTLPDGGEFSRSLAELWLIETRAAMGTKGATFARVSRPPGDPLHFWFEGWLVRPDEQGPHPWETAP